MSDIISRLKGYYTAKRHALDQFRHTHPADRGSTSLNLIREFPLYRANSDGTYKLKAGIARQSIKNTIPFLTDLCRGLGIKPLDTISISSFVEDQQSRATALALEKCFNRHGSDKSTLHDYHWFYGSILKHPDSINTILEIGLGTNDPKMPSSMGITGQPGASLKAWREFCSNAFIYGADIDRKILFQEERIATYFVDQTDPSAFASLASQVPPEFDLIIDDGLHAVDANIQTLTFGLQRLKPQGWMVIEDIAIASNPLWQIVAALLPSEFKPFFITAKNGCLFAVHFSP